MKLSNGSCVRYALPRTGGLPRFTWSLLQRTKEQGATLPNNYLLASAQALSDELTRRLNLIASEFDEELFEFEGTQNEVAVFWEEWGGEGQVAKLHTRLSELAGL
ncbi:MAG TPA: hypothetical protein VIL30_14710 [Ramlibacter sp.]|jgi:hypothetical protein